MEQFSEVVTTGDMEQLRNEIRVLKKKLHVNTQKMKSGRFEIFRTIIPYIHPISEHNVASPPVVVTKNKISNSSFDALQKITMQSTSDMVSFPI